MCRPFGPAIIAASFASSSDRATIPICCTNDSSPFFVASIASSSGSINCCIATLIATGVSSCFRPVPAALFFMAAPLPLGALRPGRPDSQAGRGAAATSRFQQGPGHPPAQAKAAYRFMSNPEVTAEGILSGHARATARRCLRERAILIAQDTTTLTFRNRAGLDLGPVNDCEWSKGLLAHSSLAIARASHDVLGVLHLHTWVRSQQKKPAHETPVQRKKRARESEHWADNQQHVADVLARAAREDRLPPPRVIAVFDREGDIFEAMEKLDALGHSFVI